MNLGRAVKLCRHQKGLTQAELAAVAGVSVSFISMLEKGKRDASISSVQEIARGLGVPISILVFLAAGEGELSGISPELIDKLSTAALGLVRSDS